MRKHVFFIFVLLFVLCLVSSAFADQEQRERYGFSDMYGVYVTGPDGNPSYVWFWSEWARQYIMGDLTVPGTSVVERPADLQDGKYPLGIAEIVSIASSGGGNVFPDGYYPQCVGCMCDDGSPRGERVLDLTLSMVNDKAEDNAKKSECQAFCKGKEKKPVYENDWSFDTDDCEVSSCNMCQCSITVYYGKDEDFVQSEDACKYQCEKVMYNQTFVAFRTGLLNGFCGMFY